MSPHAPELFDSPAAAGPGPLIAGRCEILPPKTSHHSKRIVKIGKFSRMADTEKLVSARQIWHVALLPFRPGLPYTIPLRLELELTWPWRKSDTQRDRKKGRIPCDVKPDCDNVAKGIIDTMVILGFMGADQQVVDLHVRKWIGDWQGMEFSLWRAELAPAERT